MLMGSAGKGIRQVVMHIDHDVIKPIIKRQFVYNMRYDPDENIKGDAEIIPRGAINLAVRETVNVRRVEFLNATANPVDMQIVGLNGRAALLREVAKGLQMPVDEIIPSREKLEYNVRMQQMAEMAQAQAGQAPQGAAPQGPTPPAPAPGGGAPQTNVVANQNTGAAA